LSIPDYKLDDKDHSNKREQKVDLISEKINERTQINLLKIEIEKLKGEIEFLKGSNGNLSNELSDCKVELDKTTKKLEESNSKNKVLENKLEYVEKDNNWLKSMYEELNNKTINQNRIRDNNIVKSFANDNL